MRKLILTYEETYFIFPCFLLLEVFMEKFMRKALCFKLVYCFVSLHSIFHFLINVDSFLT